MRWALRVDVYPCRKPVEMLCSDMGIMLLKFDSIATAEKLVHALNEDRQQRPRRPSLSVALRTDTLSHGFYWRFAEPNGA